MFCHLSCLSEVIFSAYSYFLLVGPLSVLFVCFTFSCSYFLIKWKVCFCFMVKRNNLTTHTDKYRMNDVTMIYKIYRKSKLCWFTCKLPNQNHNTFNMNPCSSHRFMGWPPDFFLNQNICCRYPKGLFVWDSSFEHPKHMFKLMPQFYANTFA